MKQFNTFYFRAVLLNNMLVLSQTTPIEGDAKFTSKKSISTYSLQGSTCGLTLSFRSFVSQWKIIDICPAACTLLTKIMIAVTSNELIGGHWKSGTVQCCEGIERDEARL